MSKDQEVARGHDGSSPRLGEKRVQERSQLARIAALRRWAFADGKSGTARARRAFLDGFEQAVDPDGVLPDAERRVRAARLRKAHFHDLALKSAKARHSRKTDRGQS